MEEVSSDPRASGRSAGEAHAAIERFLHNSTNPALLEPGEDLLAITRDNFVLESRGTRLTVQAWDETRNIVRRVIGLREEARGRIELRVELFGRREGKLLLIDQDRPAGQESARRSTRLVFRELFRRILTRQFPGWAIRDLSAEADLEHSLSPVYPRALLTKGQTGIAAISAPEQAGAAGILAFGLIWLDYLRRREQRLTVEALVLFVPCAETGVTSLRLRFLNPDAARYELLAYSSDGHTNPVDPSDFGNLDSGLEPCSRSLAAHAMVARLAALPGVAAIARNAASLSFRVRGLEFARFENDELLFGLTDKIKAAERHWPEIEVLVRELNRLRSPGLSADHGTLFRRNPEAWLESQVRADLRAIDPSLCPDPIYGQVPAFAGGDRGLIDLLAVDAAGRLAVIELKASADLHLPLQALDYWIRVKWHLDRGDFAAHSYFPGTALLPQPPRILLVSPALEFHPTTETILGFLAPGLDVERIGLGLEWRRRLQVLFRLRGAHRPI
jgi:hypothetical protein